MQSVEHILRAEDDWHMYTTRGPLTPDIAYSLILLTTENEKLASQTRTKMLLESMPPLNS